MVQTSDNPNKSITFYHLTNIYIQTLSANKQLKYELLIRKLMSNYIFSNIQPQDIFFIASNAVSIYLSVFSNNKPVFASAQHVMNSLSLAQIAELSQIVKSELYDNTDTSINTDTIELGYNINFPTNIEEA